MGFMSWLWTCMFLVTSSSGDGIADEFRQCVSVFDEFCATDWDQQCEAEAQEACNKPGPVTFEGCTSRLATGPIGKPVEIEFEPVSAVAEDSGVTLFPSSVNVLYPDGISMTHHCQKPWLGFCDPITAMMLAEESQLTLSWDVMGSVCQQTVMLKPTNSPCEVMSAAFMELDLRCDALAEFVSSGSCNALSTELIGIDNYCDEPLIPSTPGFINGFVPYCQADNTTVESVLRLGITNFCSRCCRLTHDGTQESDGIESALPEGAQDLGRGYHYLYTGNVGLSFSALADDQATMAMIMGSTDNTDLRMWPEYHYETAATDSIVNTSSGVTETQQNSVVFSANYPGYQGLLEFTGSLNSQVQNTVEDVTTNNLVFFHKSASVQVYRAELETTGSSIVLREDFINRLEELPTTFVLESVESGWHFAPLGATECDSGRAATQEECAPAVQSLARWYDTTPTRTMQVGSGGNCGDGVWGGVPIGCSSQTGGDYTAHFKTSGVNCSPGGYQLVCSNPGCEDKVPGCDQHMANKGCDDTNDIHHLWRTRCVKTCGYCDDPRYNGQVWKNFFDRFGTHILFKYRLGGTFSQSFETTKYDYKNILTDFQTVQTKLNIEFGKAKAGVTGGPNGSITSVDSVKCATIKQKLTVKGGHAEDYRSFAETLINKPDARGMLIFGRTVEPIFSLKNMVLRSVFENSFCIMEDGSIDCNSIDAKLEALRQAFGAICQIYESDGACKNPPPPTPAPLPPPDTGVGQPWVDGHQHRYILNIVAQDPNIKSCTAQHEFPHGPNMRGTPLKHCTEPFGTDTSNPTQNCIFHATGTWRTLWSEIGMRPGISVKVYVSCTLQDEEKMDVEIFYDNDQGDQSGGGTYSLPRPVIFTTETKFSQIPYAGTENHRVEVSGGGNIRNCQDFCTVNLFLSTRKSC